MDLPPEVEIPALESVPIMMFIGFSGSPEVALLWNAARSWLSAALGLVVDELPELSVCAGSRV